jgi:LmbE family N-acetylglucosaminyl deacetylase
VPDVEYLVLSPHFDDAVLSCGSWLERHRGAVVATVCSGQPGEGVPAHRWDAKSGFPFADAAAIRRRAEDAAALAMLGANQELLGFLDGEYKERVGHCHESASVSGPFEQAVATAIGDLIGTLKPRVIVGPMGLFHRDHIATAQAVWSVIRGRPDGRALGYVDLPYGITNRAWLQQALARLPGSGLRSDDYPLSSAPTAGKEGAVRCYRTQLEQLTLEHPRWEESLRPGVERFFEISRS